MVLPHNLLPTIIISPITISLFPLNSPNLSNEHYYNPYNPMIFTIPVVIALLIAIVACIFVL